MAYTGTALTRHRPAVKAAGQASPSTQSRSTAPALLLFFLAPFCAELLSGSSPPREYFAPFGFILMHFTYGALAVLLREWAIRRRIGNWGRVVLAASVGIFVEGVVCKSIFSPEWPDFSFPAGFGRELGVNWPWAVSLIIYHGLQSFLIPWLITDLILPRWRNTPSLQRSWMFALGVAVSAAGVVGFFKFPMNQAGEIYRPGLLASLLAWGSLLYLPWLAAQVREPRPPALPFAPKPLWLGLLAFGGWFAFFVSAGTWSNPVGRPFWLLLIPLLAVAALALVLGWNWRGALGAWQRFAIAAGSTTFWALFAFIQELDNPRRPDDTTGMALVGALALALLLLLALRVQGEVLNAER